MLNLIYLGIIWMRLSHTAGIAWLRNNCEIPDLSASFLWKAPIARRTRVWTRVVLEPVQCKILPSLSLKYWSPGQCSTESCFKKKKKRPLEGFKLDNLAIYELKSMSRHICPKIILNIVKTNMQIVSQHLRGVRINHSGVNSLRDHHSESIHLKLITTNKWLLWGFRMVKLLLRTAPLLE